MPITTKSILDQVNNKITDTNTTADDVVKLTTISGLLTAASVVSVDTEYDLPSASLNTGRLVFVNSISSYRYSNGISWNPVSNSVPVPAATVWAWGYGGDGGLGDNSKTNRSSPVSVVGGFTDWCRVSAGGSHNIGMRIF